MSETISLDALQIINNDEYFATFLQPGTNSTLAKSMTIAEQVKKLSDGIDLLSKELQVQVFENRQDLLLQANHANKLDSVLNTMNFHVQNLFANAEKLKLQIHTPYQAIHSHTRVLGRLHLASHILRRVHRIQQLSKRLASISGDPVQQATILRELEQLGADEDVAEVEVVATEVRKIRAAQQKIVKLATVSLSQAIACGNGVQATTALQIFINLGRITNTTETLVGIGLDECKESLRTAFGVGIPMGSAGNVGAGSTGPGHVAMVNAQSQGFRSRLWSDVDKAFGDEIFQQCKQIKFLQTTLNHMNCPEIKENIAKQFWGKLNEVFVAEMNKASASVQQMLVDDYPKVLKSYYSMMQKLNYNEFIYSRQIFDKFEVSYLTASLNRLLETTQGMFSVEITAPSHDQMDSLMRIITNELTVALVENELMEKSAKNIAKCVNMFAVKTEQKLSTGSDAAQVIGGAPNVGQQQNVQLANALYYLGAQIQRSVTNLRGSLTENCIKVINDSVDELDNLTQGILQPLVMSINQTVETIVVTMHQEDWRKENRSTATTCSAYLRELLQFLTRVHHTYLLHFDNKPVLINKCNDVAIRTIELLVRHAAIVCPINAAGRLRLNSDLTALERHLRSGTPAPSLCPQLADLGAPYRLLKSVASLVGVSKAEDLPVHTVASVQTSTLLFMMFGYAQQTAELLPPHKTLSWSVQQLSSWLDRHPDENQRLDLVAGALQRYETIVRNTNSTNFDPVYPIISELLAKAVEELHT